MSIKKYLYKRNKGYKHPIMIDNQLLYSSGDYHRHSSFWIRLDCLEEYRDLIREWITDEESLVLIGKMYLQYVKTKIAEWGFV